MPQLWNARLRFTLEDVETGAALAQIAHTYPQLRHVIGPTTVRLRAGETWHPVDIPGPLFTQASSSPTTKPRAVALLVTDTPGVKYLLSNEPAPPGTMTWQKLLLTGQETTREQDFKASPTPVYAAGGNWLNHNTGVPVFIDGTAFYAPSLGKTLTADQRIHYAGETGSTDVLVTGGGSLAKRASRFVWGRENKVNLGSADDGLEFDFWYYPGALAGLAEAHFVKFGSYPYVASTLEADLAATDGDGDDTTYIKQPVTPGNNYPGGGGAETIGAYWYADMDLYNPAFSDTAWNHVRLRKQDFLAHQSGGEDPDWSRITWFEFYNAFCGGPTLWSPVAVSAAAANFRTLDIAACEVLHWNDLATGYPEKRDRDRATLCLFGPPSHNANVKIFWGIP